MRGTRSWAIGITGFLVLFVLLIAGVSLLPVVPGGTSPTVTKEDVAAPPTLSPSPVRPAVARNPAPARSLQMNGSEVHPLQARVPPVSSRVSSAKPSSFERLVYRENEYGVPPLPRVMTYTVQPGDTLSTIAARFGLTLDSVRWSNPEIEHNPDDIYPGQVLRLPPINGVVVEVQEGDTVERLARRYNVPPKVIRDYAANHLSPPYRLQPGTLLIIPGGSKQQNLSPPKAYPGYMYMWPVRGVITQRFHSRHRGIDIATFYGAYVYASRSGRVRTVRWDNTGYGYMMIIDHGGGWNTLYAHLKGALVQQGEYVHQGQIIGRVGGTGRATGPHVHFEIRKGRVRYDPMQFLPPTP